MKRRRVLGFIVLAGGLLAAVTIVVWRLTTAVSPMELAISSVTQLSDGTLFAVGSRGGHDDQAVIARSNDDGAHWTVSTGPTRGLYGVSTAGTRIIASVYCLPPSIGGEPVGPSPESCLFRSDDNGSTWQDLNAGNLADPSFADSSYGWAHPQFPIGRDLFESTDAGITWVRLGPPCPSDKPLVYRATATGYRAGYVLCFGEAAGEGQPWSLIQVRPSAPSIAVAEGNITSGQPHAGLADEFVQGFAMRPDGSGLIWTSAGLYRTDDNGHSWTPVPIDELGRGFLSGGGILTGDDKAYLVRGGADTGIVEYMSGTVRTLVTWPLPVS